MLEDDFKIVQCSYCARQNKLNWMRYENAFPAKFIGSIVNQHKAEMKTLVEETYLCEEHYLELYPLKNYSLELPKN